MTSNSICNHTRDKQICAVVRFCYHSYDYRPNWTPLSPITITYCRFNARSYFIHVQIDLDYIFNKIIYLIVYLMHVRILNEHLCS